MHVGEIVCTCEECGNQFWSWTVEEIGNTAKREDGYCTSAREAKAACELVVKRWGVTVDAEA